MRLALAIVIVLLLPTALATISAVQNDGGTGGDAGNWPYWAAPIRNRHGGVAGAYSGELYRYYDEADWYQFVLPAARTDLNVSFSAQADGICAQLPPQLVVSVVVVDNTTGVSTPPVNVDPCYGADSIHVPGAGSGGWLIGFTLHTPGQTTVDPGTGPIGVEPPSSTAVHERYAFAVACSPTC